MTKEEQLRVVFEKIIKREYKMLNGCDYLEDKYLYEGLEDTVNELLTEVKIRTKI